MPSEEGATKAWNRHIHNDLGDIQARIADFANDYESYQLAAIAQLRLDAAEQGPVRSSLVVGVGISGYSIFLILMAGSSRALKPITGDSGIWLDDPISKVWVAWLMFLMIFTIVVWSATWLFRTWMKLDRAAVRRARAEVWLNFYLDERTRRFASDDKEAKGWRKRRAIKWAPPESTRLSDSS